MISTFSVFTCNFQSFPKVGFPVPTWPAVEVEKIPDSARFFSRQNTRGGRSQFYKITKGSTRTLIGCYANLRLRLGIAQLSRILPTPLVFIAGLPRARSARGTEPHTHRIWSTSFLLVVT